MQKQGQHYDSLYFHSQVSSTLDTVRLVDQEKDPYNIETWKRLTVEQDSIVIPIFPKRFTPDPFTKVPIFGGDGFLPSKIEVSNHFPVEPGWSITIHKSQVGFSCFHFVVCDNCSFDWFLFLGVLLFCSS